MHLTNYAFDSLGTTVTKRMDDTHFQFLDDKALTYTNAQQLYQLLINFDPVKMRAQDWDAYSKKFSPKAVNALRVIVHDSLYPFKLLYFEDGFYGFSLTKTTFFNKKNAFSKALAKLTFCTR